MRLILCSARIPRVYTNGWIPRPLAWTRKKEGENGESMSAGIFTTSQGHKVVLSLCSWLSGKDGVRTHPRARHRAHLYATSTLTTDAHRRTLSAS